jgi:hypothetical protein
VSLISYCIRKVSLAPFQLPSNDSWSIGCGKNFVPAGHRPGFPVEIFSALWVADVGGIDGALLKLTWTETPKLMSENIVDRALKTIVTENGYCKMISNLLQTGARNAFNCAEGRFIL